MTSSSSSQLTRPAFIPTSTSQRSPRQATRVVRQRQTNRPPNACMIIAAEDTEIPHKENVFAGHPDDPRLDSLAQCLLPTHEKTPQKPDIKRRQ